MAKKRSQSLKQLIYNATLFCQLQKKSEVFQLLKINEHSYQQLTEHPQYHAFSVGKKQGGERYIENPNTALKLVQNRLNAYLQAVYYLHKTPLAYGFVLNPGSTTDKRDILENARKHLGNDYLLNLDLKDFFHSIEVPRLWKVFGQAPFRFQREAVEALTRLVTFKGRLPMGSPTSPALSNFSLIPLDLALHSFAEAEGLTLTRYADDISISSKQAISESQIHHIKKLITDEGFLLNEEKAKYYTANDTKEVTGLLLLPNEGVGLPEHYIADLEKDIAQLSVTMLVQNHQGKLNTQWIETFKKQVRGKINFMGYVLGHQHPERVRLLDAFEEAVLPPPEEFGSYSWRNFHYQI